MSNITLVTGFFDIGRGDEKNTSLRRANQKYFEYFEHWARMQNYLIIYTESKHVDTVLTIRKKFGLGNKTKIISVDNIFEIEEGIYRRMCQVEKNEDFRKFRYYSNAYSNTAKYAYVMLMKYWMLYDAYTRNLITSEEAAWIDFGFDHGGEKYVNPEEMSFIWNYNFPKKINLFCLSDPDKILGADSLQMLCDCIMGALVYMPADMIEILWDLVRDSMKALLSLDCIDDDQQLLLMAYKRNPELFEIHISDWFMPLKEYGGGHLTVRADENDSLQYAQKVKHFIKCIYKLMFGGGAKIFCEKIL